MKRTPMPRRRQPMRRTPLRRIPGPAGATLRTDMPRRSKPLPPQSEKRRAEQQVRRKLAADLTGARCRLATEVCSGTAEHWHELVGAAHGGSRVDLRNLCPACDRCNSWVEDHPAMAMAAGMKVPPWDSTTTRGDGGLVPREPNGYAADGAASDSDRWDV